MRRSEAVSVILDENIETESLRQAVILAFEIWADCLEAEGRHERAAHARATGKYIKDTPLSLLQLAHTARKVHKAAVRDLGEGLGGGSVLDLLADNMPQVPLTTLRHVIVVAGLQGQRHEG